MGLLQCSITMVSACGLLAHCSAESYVAAMWIEGVSQFTMFQRPSDRHLFHLCGWHCSLLQSIFLMALLAVAVYIFCRQAGFRPLLKFRFLVCVGSVLESGAGSSLHMAPAMTRVLTARNEALSSTSAAMPQIERYIPSKHGRCSVGSQW